MGGAAIAVRGKFVSNAQIRFTTAAGRGAREAQMEAHPNSKMNVRDATWCGGRRTSTRPEQTNG
jgi:hypothetical protein